MIIVLSSECWSIYSVRLFVEEIFDSAQVSIQLIFQLGRVGGGGGAGGCLTMKNSGVSFPGGGGKGSVLNDFCTVEKLKKK
jgi:hypothetical protein